MTQDAAPADTPPTLPPLLVVDDDPGQRDLLQSYLTSCGFRVATAADGEQALRHVAREPVAMIVSDVRMAGMDGLTMLHRLRQSRPDLPVLLVTAYADIRDAVEAIRDGAVNYLEKPIDLDELLASVRGALKLGEATPREDPLATTALGEEIVAESRPMRDALREALIVAPTRSTVLLTGRSGVGKTLVATVIHRLSPRARQPLTLYNCAAAPAEEHEAALFGGAQPDHSLFREARGGSLLIEEIQALSPVAQTRLLHWLDPAAAGPDQDERPRLIATASRDLEAAVQAGAFAEALFYRLTSFEIYLPPLCQRPDDILPLAALFQRGATHRRARFSPATMTCLQTYSWPGNVRELKNAMERAALLSGGDVILPAHLPPRIRAAAEPAGPGAETAGSATMEDVERSIILQTLREQNFNRSETARRLGISRRSLLYKLRRYQEQGFQIDPD
ncbi:MAG TPA: sigma-54 dependent transcriptional regulator [Candidatus Sumerlaeota bacterium]|nr:sigma-54 dependent transcriptional regulator [Candidatus Sumerlaeota bacterium]